MTEIILKLYFAISAMHLAITGLYIIDCSIKGIDTFWDFIIYNLFWIVQPIKSIIKLCKQIN